MDNPIGKKIGKRIESVIGVLDENNHNCQMNI